MEFRVWLRGELLSPPPPLPPRPSHPGSKGAQAIAVGVLEVWV